ncbi:molybdenum cofactor guanylyltransferase MobA [Nevskia ramosa]|uniref:molybdenum cofactor guanylyltransferase MobA n=1 Tax=Nevskia ramosa TaxID=64002 RepID=UPI0003B45E6C|nr:molybdenum cofactor guanylyltransferase MobA [Nevskia ramosa]
MVCALLLCGGAGSRLGGVDKPLQSLAGRLLIERVLERIAPQAGDILISANRNLAQYAAYGLPVVDDGAYAHCGPLAGLAAGLAAATGDDLLCVPGDAPLLPDDLAARLDAARRSTHTAIAHADDGLGPQPLCCLVPRALLDDLLAYLAAGGRTPREWFARHTTAIAAFPEWPRWAWSANTPEEWQDAELRLADTLDSGL